MEKCTESKRFSHSNTRSTVTPQSQVSKAHTTSRLFPSYHHRVTWPSPCVKKPLREKEKDEGKDGIKD